MWDWRWKRGCSLTSRLPIRPQAVEGLHGCWRCGGLVGQALHVQVWSWLRELGSVLVTAGCWGWRWPSARPEGCGGAGRAPGAGGLTGELLVNGVGAAGHLFQRGQGILILLFFFSAGMDGFCWRS